jgi:hypothetical protein
VLFGACEKTLADTKSSWLATTRIAPRRLLKPKTLCTTFSYTLVCPAAMLSENVAGLGLLWPARRNCS